MRITALLIGFLSTLTFGFWVGISIGIDVEFKRESAFQGLLLTEYHAALVDDGPSNEQTLNVILDQAENINTLAGSDFNFGNLNLVGLFSSETRERFDGMRDHTSQYLKAVNGRSKVAFTTP